MDSRSHSKLIPDEAVKAAYREAKRAMRTPSGRQLAEIAAQIEFLERVYRF